MSKEKLNYLLERLSFLLCHPEHFIEEYFSAIRREIDLASETHLADLDGDPDEVTKKSEAINKIREWIIDEIKVQETQLQIGKLSTSLLEQEKLLADQIEFLFSQSTISNESFRELYKQTAVLIEETIMKAQEEIMQNKTVVFLKYSKFVGKLLVLKGIFVEPDNFEKKNRRSNAPLSFFRFSSEALCEKLKKSVQLNASFPRVIDKMFILKQKYIKKIRSNSEECTSTKRIKRGSRNIAPHQPDPPTEKSQVILNFELSEEAEDDGAFFYSRNELNLSREWAEIIDKDSFGSMTNLTSLDLSQNRLLDLPAGVFSKLVNLNTLNLSSNFLSQLDDSLFISLEKLTRLDLSYNSIERIGAQLFSKLTELESLDISNNKISHIQINAFDSLIQLISLDFNFNNLTQIDSKLFKNTKSLVKVNLSENRLISFDTNLFSKKMKSIHYLKLDRNKIASGKIEIDVAGKKKLEALYMGNCNIKSINRTWINKFMNLRILVLAFNKLERIDKNLLSGLKHLETLYFNYNEIKSIEACAFKNLTTLTKLNLSNNQLERLEAGIFDGIGQIETLHVSHNKINSIEPGCFKYLTRLKQLDLSYNFLAELNDERLFENIENLVSLDLSNNEIKYLAKKIFSKQENLTSLILSHNQLEELEAEIFQPLTAISELRIDHNKLKSFNSVQLLGTSGVRSIMISNNKLTQLEKGSFAYLNHLHSIDLSCNQIAFIDPEAFIDSNSLSIIEMRENKLTQITTNMFETCIQLKSIFLDKNEISFVSPDFFSKMKSIQHISLLENMIANINEIVKDDLTTGVTNLAISAKRPDELTLSRMQKSFPKTAYLTLKSVNIANWKAEYIKGYTCLKLLILDGCVESIEHSNLFDSLQSLQTLKITNNNLVKIHPKLFQGLKSIEHIDISRNQLTVIDKELFNGLENLKFLYLSYNKLETIHGQTFHELRDLFYLDISHNEFKSFDDEELFRYTKSLRKINLSNNQLTQIDLRQVFEPLSVLVSLELSNNRLDHSSINNEAFKIRPMMFTLHSLDLDGNLLTHLNFLENLYNLEDLNLSSNQIESIEKGAFKHIKSLKKLQLANNQISSISAETFVEIRSLEDLNISNNKIKSLETGSLDELKSLRSLQADGNGIVDTEEFRQFSSKLNTGFELEAECDWEVLDPSECTEF